jgi:hypothetical protein
VTRAISLFLLVPTEPTEPTERPFDGVAIGDGAALGGAESPASLGCQPAIFENNQRPPIYEGCPGAEFGNTSAIDFNCASYVTRNTMFIRDNVHECALAEAACVPTGTIALILVRN